MVQNPSDLQHERSEPTVRRDLEALERVAARSLGRPLSAGEENGAQPSGETSAAVVLRLEELLADENGHIVINVGDSLRTVILETEAQLLARGTAPSPAGTHAEGADDVCYLSFEPGTTVYFPADLDVLVSPPDG